MVVAWAVEVTTVRPKIIADKNVNFFMFEYFKCLLIL